MQTRDATPDDLEAIVEIYNSTIASREVTADLEPVTVESRRLWFEEHAPDTRPLWVVTNSDRPDAPILGWLSFSSFYGRPAYRHTAEISIYLSPKARGQGLGTALVIKAVSFAPTIEVRTLLGFIFGHNRASLALFAAQGFQVWGSLGRVAELDGVERDLIIVGRRIGKD